jgi:ATP-binding cassette subfamily B protein
MSGHEAGDDPEWGAMEVLRRGWAASPELRDGALGTVLLGMAGAVGRIVVPILLQVSIDHGLDTATGTADVGLIARFAAIAAVVIVMSAACSRAAIVRLSTRSEHALFGLRTRAFGHIHRLSLAHHAEERRGRLVARVTSDIETLSQFFSWGGISWLINGSLMVAVIVTMAVYDWRLTIVVLLTTSPLVIVLKLLQRRLVVAYTTVRERVAEMLVGTSEVVMGAAAIRAYGVEERATTRVEEAIERQSEAQQRASRLAALLFPSGEVFSVLTVSIVITLGVWQGPASGLTAGALIGFVFLVYRFLEPIAEFTEILDQTQTAVAGWRRVLAVLDTPIEIDDPPEGQDLPPGPPSIEVEHVSFAYRPRAGQGAAEVAPALIDVTFRIEPATSVAVVGATGSGKTTLAKLLTRLSDPTSGVVRVGGIDLRDVSFASLRSRLVMVPQ